MSGTPWQPRRSQAVNHSSGDGAPSRSDALRVSDLRPTDPYRHRYMALPPSMTLERFPPSERAWSQQTLPGSGAVVDHSTGSFQLDYPETLARGPNERIRRHHSEPPQCDTRENHTTSPMSQLVHLGIKEARRIYISAREELYPGVRRKVHESAFHTEWSIQCDRNQIERETARENARIARANARREANASEHARLHSAATSGGVNRRVSPRI